MKYGFVKVAAATPETLVNGILNNSQNIISQIKEAAKSDAKVIVFPELSLTGYTVGDLMLQSDMLYRVNAALSKILKETAKIDILFALGMPVFYMDKLYNVAAVCKGGRVLGFVPKSYLPGYGEYYETRYFDVTDETVEVLFEDYLVPMGKKLIFCADEMPSLRVSCELCEDMWAAVPPSANHSQNGATVILNLSASNETPGKREARKTIALANSMRQLCAYIYADAGDGESTTDCIYSGHKMILECGKTVAESEIFENGIIYGVIDTNKLSQLRKQRNTFVQKTDKDYKIIRFSTKLKETPLEGVEKTPFVPKNDERLDRIFKMQTKGLEKRLRHINLKTVTIGVSGGLDSTLALLVVVEAFKALNLELKDIIAVSMPCFGTSDRTFNNSKALIEKLGATYREISIKDAVRQHLSDIGASTEEKDVTYENAQARERTQVLMDIANKTGGIVIGTGDLSESALGFATYNGDHMSMYGVNASVPKTLIRSIVRHIADRQEESLKAILYDIVATPVSPELLPTDSKQKISQKTEEIIGPYEVHDFILYYFVRYGFSREKIMHMLSKAFGELYSEGELTNWLDIFYKRFYQNQFKRSASPDGVKATGVSLSPRGDWKMPSDAVLE